LTRDAHRRSKEAQDQADQIKMITDDAERNSKRTEGLVGRAAELFAENKIENEKSLQSLGERLGILTEEMPELNEHVSESNSFSIIG